MPAPQSTPPLQPKPLRLPPAAAGCIAVGVALVIGVPTMIISGIGFGAGIPLLGLLTLAIGVPLLVGALYLCRRYLPVAQAPSPSAATAGTATQRPPIKHLIHLDAATARPTNIVVNAATSFRSQYLPVAPELRESLAAAGELALQGNAQQALDRLEHIFHRPRRGLVTAEFLGLVELHKAYALMDLGRYEDARKVFESDALLSVIFSGQMRAKETFDFFCSYGRSLAALGDAVGMERQLNRALGFAAHELGDIDLCYEAWESLMNLAEHLQAWELLIQVSFNAVEFAKNTDMDKLFYVAALKRALAYRATKNYVKAIGLALQMRNLCLQSNLPEAAEGWENFLREVSDESKGEPPSTE